MADPAPTEQKPQLQTARVTIDITFDNLVHEHPANWNWQDLLDMVQAASADELDGPGEFFTIVSAD